MKRAIILAFLGLTLALAQNSGPTMPPDPGEPICCQDCSNLLFPYNVICTYICVYCPFVTTPVPYYLRPDKGCRN